MKPLFDRVFGRLKALFDVYKMWIFFIALIGTNGGQQLYYHEPEKPVINEKPIVKAKPTVIKPQKTIIIHKVDNEYCDRKLNEHKTGAQH